MTSPDKTSIAPRAGACHRLQPRLDWLAGARPVRTIPPMAGKLDDGGVKRPDRAPKRPRPSEVIPDAREKREEAAALVAENHQAQRQARRLRAQSGTLLDAAAQIIADVLAQRRIALAQPVDTRFRTDTGGSTGIKVIVRLQDPTKAPAARRAVVERLGSLTGPDSLEIR